MNSKTQDLYKILLHPLAVGDARPGERLASERDLAREHGVSRDTINRALTQLAADGFLERSAGRRAVYANPFSELAEEVPPEFNPSIEHLRAVLLLRAELESQAAYYCAQRASAQELVEIDREFARMCRRRQGETTLTKAKADLKFHTLVAESSHNLPVTGLSQIFYARFFNAIYAVLDLTLKRYGRYPEGIASQHNAIHAALLARDADRAAAAAREHVLYTRSMLKNADPF